MNFDEVGRIWQEEVTGEFRRTRVEDLSTARDRVAKLDAVARRSSRFATVGAIVAIPVYTFAVILGIMRGYPVSSLGFVIVAISGVSLAIEWRKLRGATPDSTLPVSEAVEAQVACLLAWERYLDTIGWRYLAPVVVGAILAMAGVFDWPAGDPVSAGWVQLSILAIVLSAFLAFSNHRSARLNVRPLREDLESWLADLRDSDLGGVPDVY